MKKNVFISYRREDSAGHSGRLYDALERLLGVGRVFMDVDTIDPGEDFTKKISSALESSFVLLAIIGKKWSSITDDQGCRRLENNDDFVRREISLAFTKKISVIPILVQDAEMPKANQLPKDLIHLTRSNALILNDIHWKSGVNKLFEMLEKLQKACASQRKWIREVEKRKRTQLLNKSLHIKGLPQNYRKDFIGKYLPKAVTLKAHMPTVRSQLSGAAVNVAIAVLSAMEYHLMRSGNHVQLSINYLYYWARQARGLKGEKGIYLTDAVDVVQRTGVVEEVLWPFSPNLLNMEPPDVLQNKPHFRVTDARRLDSLFEVKKSIHKIGPIVTSIPLFRSFISANGGKIEMPSDDDPSLGLLAICIYGYDDDKKILLFRNCWGESWGMGGDGYLPYAYFRDYAKDSWSLSAIEQ